jgi:hypothetical protein
MSITAATTAETAKRPGAPHSRVHEQLLGEAIAGYRLLGWRVSVTEQGVFLPLGPSTTALAMPARIGSRVLADLKARMLAGPVTWANPPSHSRHWFPPFTAVLALARSAAANDR